MQYPICYTLLIVGIKMMCLACVSVHAMYRVFPFIQLITKSPLRFMNYTKA